MPVEIVRRGAGAKYDSRKSKKTANEILNLLGERRAELSVVLIGNSEMRKSNARYRKKDVSGT